MNHRFYNKSKKRQNRILIIIALCALTMVFLSIVLALYSGVYLIGVLIFLITLSVIAPFFDMPSLKKSGKIIYYSPLFLAEPPKDGKINIHGGTLFDYYFVIDKHLNGKQRKDFIIRQYLSGLLVLIDTFKDNSELKVCGTSYIINERTAAKIGFGVAETSALKKMIMYYNFFNILISNSIAKNKLSFPNLNNIKTFEADISQLKKRKEYIIKLNNALVSGVRNK